MGKLFGSVFWDYSEKPLNLQGRICLQYSLYWGFLGLLLIYVLDPATVRLVAGRPLPAAAYVLAVLVTLTVLSSILTLLAFHRFDQKVAHLKAQRDSTPPLTIDAPRTTDRPARAGRGDDQHVPADEPHRGVLGAPEADRGRPAPR